jgi:hypothetical protein
MDRNNSLINGLLLLFLPVICFIGIFVCIGEEIIIWKEKLYEKVNYS